MATKKKTETKKTTTTKKSTGTTAKKTTETTQKAVAKETPLKTRKIKKDLPLNTLVPVVNGFHGSLIYRSRRNDGMTIIWDEFGDVEYVELQEMVSARSSQKKFFTANWWLIDDPDVLEFLGVTDFYKHAFDAENFDDMFKKTPSQIKTIISEMTDGQKKSLAYRAIELINSGELDSRKTIEVLEGALGLGLLEG